MDNIDPPPTDRRPYDYWRNICEHGLEVLGKHWGIWDIVVGYLFTAEQYLWCRAFMKPVSWNDGKFFEMGPMFQSQENDQDAIWHMVFAESMNEGNTYMGHCLWDDHDELFAFLREIRDVCGPILERDMKCLRMESEVKSIREVALYKVHRQLVFLKLDFIISAVVEMLSDEKIVTLKMWKERQKEVELFLDYTLPSFQYFNIKKIVLCPDLQRSLLANQGVIAEFNDDESLGEY